MSDTIIVRGTALGSSIIVFLPVLGGFISSMIGGAFATGAVLYLFWKVAGILTIFNLNHPNFGEYFFQGFIRLPSLFFPTFSILLFIFFTTGLLFLILGLKDFFIAQTKEKGVVNIGIYKITRHPQNLGIILLGLGVFLASLLDYNGINQGSILIRIGDIYSIIIFSAIWAIESVWEEERMMIKNTEDYSNYKKKTAFMIPYLRSLKVFRFINPNIQFKYKLIMWSITVVIFIFVTAFLADFFDILYHTR